MDNIKRFIIKIHLNIIVMILGFILIAIVEGLRLFDYNVLGKGQEIILIILFALAYYLPQLNVENTSLIGIKARLIEISKTVTAVLSPLFMALGIFLIVLGIIVKSDLFYVGFGLFLFMGFYLDAYVVKYEPNILSTKAQGTKDVFSRNIDE